MRVADFWPAPSDLLPHTVLQHPVPPAQGWHLTQGTEPSLVNQENIPQACPQEEALSQLRLLL